MKNNRSFLNNDHQPHQNRNKNYFDSNVKFATPLIAKFLIRENGVVLYFRLYFQHTL